MRSVPVALIVATHPQQCKALVRAFDQLAMRSALAFTVEDACRALDAARPALVVTAPTLRDGTYRDILRHASKRNLPTVLLLRREHAQEYVSSAKPEVAGLLTFPFSPAEVAGVVRQICKPGGSQRNLAASA
jgi:DNA-binding NtrC family response regulator